MEEQPGTRGTTKLCTRKVDFLHINLVKKNAEVNELVNMEMPVGAYTGCRVSPTCGLWAEEGVLKRYSDKIALHAVSLRAAVLF